jgi:hypothetical protein
MYLSLFVDIVEIGVIPFFKAFQKALKKFAIFDNCDSTLFLEIQKFEPKIYEKNRYNKLE